MQTTALTFAITATQQTLTVDDPYLTGGAVLAFDAEYVTVLELLSPTQAKVLRGANGSAAIAHAAGVVVDVGTPGEFLTGPQILPSFGVQDEVYTGQGPAAYAEFDAGGSGTVVVDEGLDGTGSALDPINVQVDGVTIVINGSNQLESVTGGSGDVTGPASATDEAITRFNGATGKLLQNSTVTLSDAGLITGATFPNTGLNVNDTNASHTLGIIPGSDLSAHHTLTLVTGDADRVLTIAGTASVAGTNTGDVTLAGTPDYITISGQVITRGAVDLTAAADITGDLPLANLVPAAADSTLLGRGDSGAGDWQAITLGANLTMTGTELDAVSSGGAPDDATYITQTAHAGLSAEQALSTLSSGIMRVATTTGVITSLTTSAGIAANISDETGTGVLVFNDTPTLIAPLLGTPTSGTLTNTTGFPVANLAGAGVGVLTFLATPSSANLAAAVTGETGTGALVFNDTPTFIAPLLGTPTSGVLTNATGYTIANLAGAGTGVLTALGVNVGTAGAFVVNGGALGTPSSGTLTNTTGFPAASLAGLGTGVATWLATPSSANLAAAVTGETGSDALVFANTPTLVTPVLGVATATSINKVAITAPASSATLTIADGKTLTASNTLTFTGTDSSSVAFGAGGTVLYTVNSANILTIPGSDHTAIGPTTVSFNAGATITVMDLVYMKSDSEWVLTDADAAATASGLLAISLANGTDGNPMNVALKGCLVRDDTWNWTPGVPLYVDTATPGAIVASQPSGTDDVIRVVGFAVTADVIMFDPSPDYITHT